MSDVLDMYEGNMDEAVSNKFDTFKEYMSDKGNHICPTCGLDMVDSSGCYRCPKCGGHDCGS